MAGFVQMRLASITLGMLVLILLMMVPVEGTPSLHSDSHATYKLSASITFPVPICEVNPITDTRAAAIACPMIAEMPLTIGINGTLSWDVNSLNKTTVGLKVTKDLSISSDDATTVPAFQVARSFNESIDIATRVSTILPFIMPEVENALAQVQNNFATGVPAGLDLASSMSLIVPIMHPHLYTMWWVNGPLKANDSVPVLFLHTNVTGTTKVDLGGLGKRDAWTLFYSFPGISPLVQPMTAGTNAVPINEGFGANFTFNYDQNGDALLSATANIHFRFLMRTPYQPPCSGVCPAASSPTIVTRSFGFNIHASLILSSTNLNLDQRLDSTDPIGGPSQGPGPGSNPGPGPTQGSGPGGSGGSGGPSSGPAPSQGTDPGSASGSGPNPNKTPESISKTPQPGAIRWIYWLLAIVAVAIIASGIWMSRRRNRKTTPQTTPTTP